MAAILRIKESRWNRENFVITNDISGCHNEAVVITTTDPVDDDKIDIMATFDFKCPIA